MLQNAMRPPDAQTPEQTCRLQDRGVRVLVERAVNRLEFPEFDIFDPAASGAQASSRLCCGASLVLVTGVSCTLRGSNARRGRTHTLGAPLHAWHAVSPSPVPNA